MNAIFVMGLYSACIKLFFFFYGGPLLNCRPIVSQLYELSIYNTNFNVRTTDIFKMFKLWKLLYILKADRIAMIQFNFNCLFQTHADTC